MRSLALLVLLASLLLGCEAGKKVENNPVPKVVKSSHETQTADGWTIALRRHRLNTGTRFCEPIIMSSGFLENGNIFDVSPQNSLAEFLAKKGFDVWTYDIRGTGNSQSPEVSDLFGWDFGVDEFVYFDTPAAMQYILDTTGCDQVFWVSHSLGSLMMYGYLETNDASRVKGAISLCGLGILTSDQNIQDLFNQLFFSVGMTIEPFLPPNMPLPIRWALDKSLGDGLDGWSLVSFLLNTDVAKVAWNHENMDMNTTYQILKNIMPNTSTNVLKQYFNWASDGHCYSQGVSYTPMPGMPDPFAGLPQAPLLDNGDGSITVGKNFSFTDQLWKINTPMLIISGEKDPVVPPTHAQYVASQIASPDKTYVNCSKAEGHSADYGHMDLLVGKKSRIEVYPNLSDWLIERASYK